MRQHLRWTTPHVVEVSRGSAHAQRSQRKPQAQRSTGQHAEVIDFEAARAARKRHTEARPSAA